MSTAKQYFIMFEAKEGGVINPISWSTSAMTSDSSIIIIDEENLVIWLWNGKGRSLIDRRTAFRQAESLKGHGYTIGNTIYGRGLTKVIEIDERKIGKDPETDKVYEQFKGLIESSFSETGNFVVSKSGGGEGAAPKPAPKAESKLEAPKVQAAQEKKSEPVVVAPKLEKKADAPAASGALSDFALQGIFIQSAIDVFSDVFISKKSSGFYSMENLDSQICEFKIENGELKFNPGSFEKIDSSKKDDILANYKKNKTR